MNPDTDIMTDLSGSYTGYFPIDPAFLSFAHIEPKEKDNSRPLHLLVERELLRSRFRSFTDAASSSMPCGPFSRGSRPTILPFSRLQWSYGFWDFASGGQNQGVSWSTLKPEVVFADTFFSPTIDLKMEFCSKLESIDVRTTESSTNLTERRDLLFDNIKMFLEVLVNDYVVGIIDIPDIARRLGDPWTESEVVELLEQLGAHRPISAVKLSTDERESILLKLANIRGTAQAQERIKDRRSMRREVIASQRIESVHVRPEDLSSE